MIIFDQITQASSNGNFSFEHYVASADAVLLIFAGGTNNVSSVTVNGIAVSSVPGADANAVIYFVLNPRVGLNTISVNFAINGGAAAALTLLGVDKKSPNIPSVTQNLSAATASLNIQSPIANSLIISLVGGATPVPNASQTQLFDISTTLIASYKFGYGLQNMSYTGGVNGGHTVVAIPAAQAPSIAFPNIGTRNIRDVINRYGLDTVGVDTINGAYIGLVSAFWKNSFLHTIGRILTPSSGALAAITGTITPSATEADIVAGGKTIIITLTGDTWIAAGAASFDLQRANILQGLDSAQSEATGWNLQVRDTEVVTAVVRTSDTVVTVTLSASPLYDITANETITVTVPGTAVTGGNAIVATPTFDVTFGIVGAVLSAFRNLLGVGV